MSDIKTSAEFYLYGLMENFARAEDAIAWADSVIIQEDRPPAEVIELSVCHADDVHAVLKCLRAVRGSVDHPKHFAMLLDFYAKRFAEKGDISRAVGDLWHLSYHEGSTKEFRADAAAVDELADLTFERLKPESELRNMVELVFEKYGGRTSGQSATPGNRPPSKQSSPPGVAHP